MVSGIESIPDSIKKDMEEFIRKIEEEKFDKNLLFKYGLRNEVLLQRLKNVFQI